MATDLENASPEAVRGGMPGSGPALVFSLTLALLCVVLLTLFFVSYSLLATHPEHAPDLARQSYAALVAGLGALAACGLAVYAGLLRPLRERHRQVAELQAAIDAYSHHDQLTGALNRTAFDQMIVRALEALRRYGAGFCGIMADVDGFRAVNEAHGYEAGDQVLVELAQLLKGHVRKADSVFRWRSGRFLVLAPGIGPEQALLMAEKLRGLAGAHAFSHEVRLTLSLGLAQAQPEDSPEAFVGRVKAALAQAKARGGVAQA